jgi:hypothetical protein
MLPYNQGRRARELPVEMNGIQHFERVTHLGDPRPEEPQ